MGGNPKIRVFPPKWMVKIMENLIKIDDLGGKTHYFRKHSYGKVKEGKRKQVENWWFGFVVWDSNRGALK